MTSGERLLFLNCYYFSFSVLFVCFPHFLSPPPQPQMSTHSTSTCVCQLEMAEGISLSEARTLERDYFAKHEHFNKVPPTLLGGPSLTTRLTDLLVNRIRTVLPVMKVRLGCACGCLSGWATLFYCILRLFEKSWCAPLYVHALRVCVCLCFLNLIATANSNCQLPTTAPLSASSLSCWRCSGRRTGR